MKKKLKYLVPIYGLKDKPKEKIKIDKNILLRAVDLFTNEHKLFEGQGLRSNYKGLLEIDYVYDSNNPSEPYPAISLRILNRFDAALLVFGEGMVGVAGVFTKSKRASTKGFTISSSNPRYEECLTEEIKSEFADYYKSFLKAYDMRPLAFDMYRRSRDRFTNNDRTIDNCTVLESIFVPKAERSKKSFILSGMKIMGFDSNDIARIDNLVEYRNSIIHADMEKQLKLLSGSKYTHKWFEDTFKLIRIVLYNFVQKPWK